MNSSTEPQSKRIPLIRTDPTEPLLLLCLLHQQVGFPPDPELRPHKF